MITCRRSSIVVSKKTTAPTKSPIIKITFAPVTLTRLLSMVNVLYPNDPDLRKPLAEKKIRKNPTERFAFDKKNDNRKSKNPKKSNRNGKRYFVEPKYSSRWLLSEVNMPPDFTKERRHSIPAPNNPRAKSLYIVPLRSFAFPFLRTGLLFLGITECNY